jgi:hypothetical protein
MATRASHVRAGAVSISTPTGRRGGTAGGRPVDTYDPGAHPFSERETQIARKLILRIRPRITIWFHPDSPCFTVEPPAGTLSPPRVDHHVRAVLALAARAGGSAYT